MEWRKCPTTPCSLACPGLSGVCPSSFGAAAWVCRWSGRNLSARKDWWSSASIPQKSNGHTSGIPHPETESSCPLHSSRSEHVVVFDKSFFWVFFVVVWHPRIFFIQFSPWNLFRHPSPSPSLPFFPTEKRSAQFTLTTIYFCFAEQFSSRLSRCRFFSLRLTILRSRLRIMKCYNDPKEIEQRWKKMSVKQKQSINQSINPNQSVNPNQSISQSQSINQELVAIAKSYDKNKQP